MKWTKDKPTEPGWYWLKDNCGEAIVEVLEHDGYLWFEYQGDEYPLDEDNEWAGPIPRPG